MQTFTYQLCCSFKRLENKVWLPLGATVKPLDGCSVIVFICTHAFIKPKQGINNLSPRGLRASIHTFTQTSRHWLVSFHSLSARVGLSISFRTTVRRIHICSATFTELQFPEFTYATFYKKRFTRTLFLLNRTLFTYMYVAFCAPLGLLHL